MSPAIPHWPDVSDPKLWKGAQELVLRLARELWEAMCRNAANGYTLNPSQLAPEVLDRPGFSTRLLELEAGSSPVLVLPVEAQPEWAESEPVELETYIVKPHRTGLVQKPKAGIYGVGVAIDPHRREWVIFLQPRR